MVRKNNDLSKETVLITLGPTQESIDPVRYLSNRSSGRMGFALAQEAMSRGARVIIVSGPVGNTTQNGCEVDNVTTSKEMLQAVLKRLPESSIVILAAAVADYKPMLSQEKKIKKRPGPYTLELEPTVDIAREIGQMKGKRLLVGFSAETENLIENAAVKLRQKNCDFIVANPVGTSANGAGIDSDENQGVLLAATGEQTILPRSKKIDIARKIFDELLRQRPV